MKNNLLFRRIFVLLLLCTVSALSWAVIVNIDGVDYELIEKAKVARVYRLYSPGIANVIIPTTVTYNEVEYPVTSIGKNAFEDCSKLTSITIPASVTSIEEKAFEGCSGLTKAEFASIESLCNIKFNESQSSNVSCNPLTHAHHLYIDGQEVKKLVIPNSVTSIRDHTFKGCSGLTSVTIPNSVTSIGNEAFRDCSGLTSVTIGNSVKSIGDWAFGSCSGLTSVNIPNSVTSIGERAFFYCPGLTSITVASGNTKYDSRNDCNAIIETSSNTLVSGCKNTVIPNTVTSIGDEAFSWCSSLTSITIPNSVTSIGEYAFSGCSGLTSVTIPNSVTSIGESAFRSCSGLTSVTIGNGVTSIGRWAFEYCKDLADVFCYAEKAPRMYNGVFTDSDVEYATLYVPKSSVDAYKAADQWKEFGNIVGFDPTAVEELKSNKTLKANENAPIYDLMGRRLQQKPTSGYYIQGGKKYFVK